MNVRQATPEDLESIRSIARDSLAASYAHFLDEDTIDAAVEQWYGDSLEADLESDSWMVLLAESDGSAVGFSQCEFLGEGQTTGRILWIHVHPDHRGNGVGVRLLARTREGLLEDGAEHIRATVLAGNEDGNAFYDAHGFEAAGTNEVEIGEGTFTENVYVESATEAEEAWRGLEEVALDGETVFVGYGEAARGSAAPFYATYESANGASRYGWFCGNCNTLDNAMDAMGRIQCNECGNRRKATRWDASYL